MSIIGIYFHAGTYSNGYSNLILLILFLNSQHCLPSQALLSGKLEKIPQPIPLASEALMKKLDFREGVQLKLKDPATCTVSFAPGSEKSVYFAVYGLPKVKCFDPYFPGFYNVKANVLTWIEHRGYEIFWGRKRLGSERLQG